MISMVPYIRMFDTCDVNVICTRPLSMRIENVIENLHLNDGVLVRKMVSRHTDVVELRRVAYLTWQI